MNRPKHDAVFDCVVYAQFLINMDGPAAHCVEEARKGYVHLFASPHILSEIRALPFKLPPKYKVTIEDAAQLAEEVRSIGTIVDSPQRLYAHPIDPDDSEYINLALATNCRLVISRDKHLLNLMDVKRPESKEFRSRYPQLIII